MKPVILLTNENRQTYHINANQVSCYYSSENKKGQTVVIVIGLDKALVVMETPEHIDMLMEDAMH